MMWCITKTTWYTYDVLPKNALDGYHGNAGARSGIYRNGTMQCKRTPGWCRGPTASVYGGIRSDVGSPTPRLILHLSVYDRSIPAK